MDAFSPSLENLIDSLATLPAIGRKSAQRLAFHILKMDEKSLEKFISSINNARQLIHRCPVCCNLTDGEICSVCSSGERDRSLICVVENPKDVVAFEKTHEYNGLYHVLHGVISPMNDINPEDICIKELIGRLAGDEVKEVILATNPTVEGEATALFISKLIKPVGVTVSRLAYGVPVGAELEYTDEFTLVRAMEGRRTL
ncbi:MAG: recombination mediator RecR [Clostridiales bacterium]|nr:recombination mediator RecR [Clostridiales bacterium]